MPFQCCRRLASDHSKLQVHQLTQISFLRLQKFKKQINAIAAGKYQPLIILNRIQCLADFFCIKQSAFNHTDSHRLRSIRPKRRLQLSRKIPASCDQNPFAEKCSLSIPVQPLLQPGHSPYHRNRRCLYSGLLCCLLDMLQR